ncbi:MAG: hypothetical protein HKN82_17330, partial [Akkermansiaceae bacterium]|nr:hypothetical protein [Akkermansiaceae bacterium]
MKAIFLIPTLFLVPLAASAGVVLSEIDLAGNRVELINTGGSAADLTGWWWCNRVNGSPFYALVTSNSTVDAGLSSPGATLTNFGAGQVMVLDLTSGFLPDANGELGLYTTNSFGSASAIHDYVLWGGSGIRDLTAQNAGIWIDNDSISVAGLGAGDTIQLKPGLPGNSAADYEIAPSTLGAEQVAAPVELAI